MTGSAAKPLRWGILGCGFISGDFVRAMDSGLYPNEVHAVAAANSLERAHEFRNGHFRDDCSKGRVECYGTYAELLARDDIDVVYVGVANHLHKSTVLQALNAKKHVLCEKPMAVNAKEVREMIEAAKRNKCFLMEAYWSRYFPVWEHIRNQGLKEIGGARTVICDFGINIERVKSTPLEHGGGYLLANGCYAVMFAQFAFNGERPQKIVATGQLDENGIDIWANVVMTYSDNRMASVFYHGLQETPCQASISGPNGQLKLPEYFWSPSVLTKKVGVNGEFETLEFPLPEPRHQFFYPNSDKPRPKTRKVGLCYEADHVFECLRDGKLESPVTPLSVSLQLAEIFDEIRSQLGLRFPQDA